MHGSASASTAQAPGAAPVAWPGIAYELVQGRLVGHSLNSELSSLQAKDLACVNCRNVPCKDITKLQKFSDVMHIMGTFVTFKKQSKPVTSSNVLFCYSSAAAS